MKAPERRIDNAMSKLHDSTCLLYMHLKVAMLLQAVHARRVAVARHLRWHWGRRCRADRRDHGRRGIPWQLPDVRRAERALSRGRCGGNSVLAMRAKALTSDQGRGVRRQYLRQIVEGDEFVKAKWLRVRPQRRGPEDEGHHFDAWVIH